MTLINYEGEREATTHNSTSYGKKVVEFMELKDYFLVRDSDLEGTLQDKIFRRPKFDGEKETVIEVKYTDLSLSNPDFLREIGKYCIIYFGKDVKFYLKVFARRLRNITKWKSIFDDSASKYAEIKKFRKSVQASLPADLSDKLKSIEIKDFKSFIEQIEIFQAGYENLVQKITDLKERKKFNKKEWYLEEKQFLVYKKGKVFSNIFKVASFPKIYSYKSSKSIDDDLWSQESFVIVREKIFSLQVLPEKIISKYSLEKVPDLINIDDLIIGEKEKLGLKKRIIEQFIISKGKNRGYSFDRRSNCLYVVYENASQSPLKLKGNDGHKRRIVARAYFKDGVLNFVAHRALRFRVTDIDGELYVVFNFLRIFTKDGNKIIEGEGAKNLHYRFTPTNSSNSQEYSLLDFLTSLLDLKTQDLNHPNFISIKRIDAEVPCQMSDGENFDETLEYEMEDNVDE